MDDATEFWVSSLSMRSDCLLEEEVNELQAELCRLLRNEETKLVLVGGVTPVNISIDCLKLSTRKHIEDAVSSDLLQTKKAVQLSF